MAKESEIALFVYKPKCSFEEARATVAALHPRGQTEQNQGVAMLQS